MCLCRALAFHLHEYQKLEKETSGTFNFLMSGMDQLCPSQFHGVHMDNIPIVDDLLLLKIVFYDLDLAEECAETQEYCATIKL